MLPVKAKTKLQKSCSEKKRRERISAHLEELKFLLPRAKKEVRKGKRLEKEKILDYAVAYLRSQLSTIGIKDATPANFGRQSTAGSGYKDGYRRCMQETVNFFANKTPRNCLPSGLFKHLIGVFERLPNGTSGGYRAPNACNPIRVTPHRPTSECSKQMGHYLEHFSVSNKCSQPDLSPAQVITPADNLCPTPSCTLHNRAQFWRPWA